MSEREVMLDRIRKALGRRSEPYVPPAAGPPLRDVMPPILPEALLAKFEAELQQVAGQTHRASNISELENVLCGILESSQAAAVVLSRNPLLAQLGVAEKLRAWGKTVTTWPDAGVVSQENEAPQILERKGGSFAATVGITGIDFALAETGSLILSSRTEGSQLASLAPPVHVALYRRNQLVASLEEVLERLPLSREPDQASPGRSVVFITGTSRTADIEQILVRGVHGPRELHALLIEATCLGGEGSTRR